MDVSSAVSSIGSSVTSPAKLAFAGYVALALMGRIATSRLDFAIAAVLFFCVQVFHDDYLRIVLNRRAELRTASLNRD